MSQIKLLVIILFAFSVGAQAQITRNKGLQPRSADSLGVSKKGKAGARPGASKVADTIATVDMYKAITLDRDTTYVDTALTIKTQYTANYLRKDVFGLLPFNNVGHTYNTLFYGLKDYNPYPEFGFAAKHFAYMQADDIKYYNVPTPFTDLFYRSVLEQGQILDAMVTANTSPNLNFFIGYKGIRSIGKYVNNLNSNGNFRVGISYNTTNRRYMLKAHFTGQDFTSGENGGIINLENFESKDPIYDQRDRLEVYLDDAKSVLKGNRYFADHTYRLSKDNPNSIVVHHRFNYEHKFFEYTEPTPLATRFGSLLTSNISDKTRYNRMYNLVGAAYTHETIGDLEFYVEDYVYNYYYNRIVLDEEGNVAIPNSLSDRIDSYGARYTYQKNKWKGTVLVSNSITDQSLTNIDAAVRYTFNDDNVVRLRYQKMNKLPELNYRLYQSGYKAYNWFNEFKNEKINNFEAEAETKWGSASLQYTILNDHLYFSNDSGLVNEQGLDSVLTVTPKQYGNTINYLSLKVGREFRFWRLALDNTILYQQVGQSSNVLNVPDFVTRNTLYYSGYFFKKALFIQSGVTFQYFTEYYANDYNPVIGEFYTQERKKVGGYPLLDFFLNAKIRQFRLLLKAEHFNSGFNKPNYYSAPNYPYRDFTIRLGIIWDFFT